MRSRHVTVVRGEGELSEGVADELKSLKSLTLNVEHNVDEYERL